MTNKKTSRDESSEVQQPHYSIKPSNTDALATELRAMICEWNAPTQLAMSMDATCFMLAAYIERERVAARKHELSLMPLSGSKAIDSAYFDTRMRELDALSDD